MPISGDDPLLDVAGLSTGYGKIGVLHGIKLSVRAGEVVALLGPNGAGKTTLLRAVSGLLPWSGSVRFAGRDLAGSSPRHTVKAGLTHVIEGHRVFTQLAVLDNLLLAIGRSGTGVLLVEHHADLIFDICHHVTVLNLGRILAAGTPAEIQSHREVVNAYLGG